VDTNQTFVFPHLWLGSEAQWAPLLAGTTNAPYALGPDYIKYFLQCGPTWHWQDFTYDIIQQADLVDPGNATADDFDLTPFMRRGGKLLHYHGASDGLIPTGSSVYLYSQILRQLSPRGVDISSFYRFFVVPGMQHCAGTPGNVNAPWYFAGANQAAALGSAVHGVPGFRDAKHDVLLAVMAWVENGTAPGHIVATKWVDDAAAAADRLQVMRQRPLCFWPAKQQWNGKGHVDRADSWTCTTNVE
jgi:feruloyl esterase